MMLVPRLSAIIHAQSLSRVQLFATLWTTRLLCPWDFLGKNTGVGCHLLLYGIFLNQGSNPWLLHFLHLWAGSLSLNHLGSPPRLRALLVSKCLPQHKAYLQGCFKKKKLIFRLKKSQSIQRNRKKCHIQRKKNKVAETVPEKTQAQKYQRLKQLS